MVTTETSVHRSGLLDTTFRFSVNLKGGPGMTLPEMRQWRQKTLLGVTLKVVAPTGQCDPTKLVNFGANRWAFKPEVGVSKRWGVAARYLRRSLALHHESRILFAECGLSRNPIPIARHPSARLKRTSAMI